MFVKDYKMKKMQASAVKELFIRFYNRNPHPKTELIYTNDYTLLVAVVLSAQATDIGVNKATEKLFKLVDNPQSMLDLGLNQLESHIKTIGLWRAKAANVIKLSQSLVQNFGGKVPDNLEDLMSLAGVGRKTANVVLNTAFGKKTMAVDTHVFRVSRRLGLSDGNSPEAVEADLLKIIPDAYLYDAHHWLILHGRYICKARNPLCNDCFVSDLCLSYSNNLA